MKKKTKKFQGFTLIEIMIVIAIIAIISTIAIPNYIQYKNKSLCARVEADVHNNAKKATAWLVDHTDISSFTPSWSNGVSQRTLTLSASGVLIVVAEDSTGMCPFGTTYSIIGGGTSGAWE